MSKLRNRCAAMLFRFWIVIIWAEYVFERNRYCDDSLDGAEQNLNLGNDVTQTIITDHILQHIIR